MNRSAHHESAHLHVQGLATYIDDLPLTEGTLHAAPILSNAASGRIFRFDLHEAGASRLFAIGSDQGLWNAVEEVQPIDQVRNTLGHHNELNSNADPT